MMLDGFPLGVRILKQSSRSARLVARVALFCATIGICIASPVSAAEGPLRWKLATGQKLRAEWTQRVETDTAIGDKPLRLIVDTTLELDWVVESVDASGNATITQSFRRIAVRMDMPPAAPLEFDSSSSKRPTGDLRPIADSLVPLIGPNWKSTLSPRGEVTQVAPSPELTAALEKVGADGRLKGLFSGVTGAEGLRRSLVVLPEGPVKSGDMWEVPTETDSPVGRVKIVSKYHHRGVEVVDGQSLDAIDSTGEIDWTPLATKGLVKERKITEQKQSGVTLFDATAGRVVESRQTQSLRTESRVRDLLLDVRLKSTLGLKLFAVE